MRHTPAVVESVEYDGRFTVTYRTSDMGHGEVSAFVIDKNERVPLAKAEGATGGEGAE